MINLKEKQIHQQERSNSLPEWYKSFLHQRLTAHRDLGLPSPKDENWRSLPIRDLLDHNYIIPETDTDLEIEDIKEFVQNKKKNTGNDAINVVIVNGKLSQELSDDVSSIEGLEILNLSETLVKFPEKLKSIFDHSVESTHTYAALNDAKHTDLTFIHLEKNRSLPRPIHCMYLSSGDSTDIHMHNTKTLIYASKCSSCFISESYYSLNKTLAYSNVTTDIHLESSASIHHVKIQDESNESFHLYTSRVYQQRDSIFKSCNLTFGGKFTRNDIFSYLDDENITCTLDGVYILDHQQVCANYTSLDHAKPNCYSFEVYKGILDDSSTGLFNGKIYVHQDAQKTDAKQSNQAILLSENAKIHTKPQLEIYADDVKCTHGCTVGKMDKDPLFYLQARGLSKKDAKNLLIYAFAAEVLENIDNDHVRKNVEERLYHKLNNKN